MNFSQSFHEYPCIIINKTYVRSKVLNVSEEWIEDLPGWHDDDIDDEEDANHKEQLRIFHHL